MGSPVRIRRSGPKKADDMGSGRHDLQYFEMFCDVGAGKANRLNGSINWVLKPAHSATALPVAQATPCSGEERTPGY